MASVFPAKELLAWFSAHQRPLPWRKGYDPYHVWISEIMAQQTRIEQMQPYYTQFLARFPNVKALADAEEQDVLKHWEGLGYYSRARNLHAAAKQVMEKHAGKLPRTQAELQTLKGFGPYISAAVASIAFEQDVPVVDGNVLRVMSRFWERSDDIALPSARKKIESRLQGVMPKGNARAFNQGLMELGATTCVPINPLCAQCPIHTHCGAFKHGTQAQFPVKSKKGTIPTKHFAMIRVSQGDKVWLVQRTSKLLHGMWEFPSVEFSPLHDSKEAIEEAIQKAYGVRLTLGANKGEIAHQYSHFTQIVHVFDATPSEIPPALFSRSQLAKLPMSKIQLKVLDALK